MHEHVIHEAIVANTAAVSSLSVVLGKLTARLDADVATRKDVRDLGLALVGALDALRDEVHEKNLRAVAKQTARLDAAGKDLAAAVAEDKAG
jgi:hypothetical protein